MSWQQARAGVTLGQIAAVGLVALLTAAGFGLLSTNPITVGGERAAEEMDVREAVLRYQFQHNASAQQASAQVFCITVANADAGDNFLARFASHGVPVRKASACKIDGNGVFDPATNAKGLQLNVDTVTWVAGDEATVSGGYYEASLSASSNLYRVKKTGEGWVVVEDRLLLIS